MNAWFRSVAALLQLASKIPHIERLDMTSVNMYPKADAMFRAVIDLLSCDDRTWTSVSIADCHGLPNQFMSNCLVASNKIKSLCLIDNDLSRCCFEKLGPVVKHCWNCARMPVFPFQPCKNLADGLKNNKTLTRLDRIR